MPGPLRQPSFRQYFLSETISTFGTGMLFIGINWYVRESSGSNAAVGLVLSLAILSGFVVFPLAGTVADRFPRRSTLLVLNLTRALLFAAFLAASLLGPLNFRLIYALVAGNGIGFAFSVPVSRSFLQEIVEREQLVAGNALMEMSMQAGAFVSAGLAGMLLEAVGIPVVFAAATFTQLLAALLLSRVRYRPLPVRDAAEAFFAQFARGLAYLAERRRLLLLGIVMQVPFVVVIVSNVVLPGYVENRLQAGAVVFGLADMSYGLAAFCASLLLSLLGGRLPRRPLLAALYTTVLLALGGLYLNRFVAGLFLGLFLFGLGNTPLKILLSSILMEVVEKDHFGRAMAFWTGVSSVLQVALSFGLGLLLDSVPERNGYLALAVVAAFGFALLFLLLPARAAAAVTHSPSDARGARGARRER
jgi:MFS family permease